MADFRLDRFASNQAIIDANGKPTPAMQKVMNKAWGQIEQQINSLVQALAVGQEYMADIPAVTITADNSGTVSPSAQLPKAISCQRMNGATDVTADASWSAVARRGTATFSVATGVITLTALTADDVLDVTSSRDVEGVTMSLTKALEIYLSKSGPAITGDNGSGGTSSTAEDFASFNSTTMATVATLTAKAGSGGQVDLSAPLDVTTAGVLPNGTFQVFGIWQWDSTGGGVWVDLGSEVASSPSCKVTAGDVTNGYLSVSQTKTGLTSGTDYNFRLQARNNTGTRTMSLIGTASAVGS